MFAFGIVLIDKCIGISIVYQILLVEGGFGETGEDWELEIRDRRSG